MFRPGLTLGYLVHLMLGTIIKFTRLDVHFTYRKPKKADSDKKAEQKKDVASKQADEVHIHIQSKDIGIQTPQTNAGFISD